MGMFRMSYKYQSVTIKDSSELFKKVNLHLVDSLKLGSDTHTFRLLEPEIRDLLKDSTSKSKSTIIKKCLWKFLITLETIDKDYRLHSFNQLIKFMSLFQKNL